MDSSNFDSTSFTDVTKRVCVCSAISIFLIVLFVITPLSNFFLTSIVMKIITLIILLYTIYLNNEQTNLLVRTNNITKSKEVNYQLNINIFCSYIFTLFIGLLIIFLIKSFLI